MGCERLLSEEIPTRFAQGTLRQAQGRRKGRGVLSELCSRWAGGYFAIRLDKRGKRSVGDWLPGLKRLLEGVEDRDAGAFEIGGVACDDCQFVFDSGSGDQSVCDGKALVGTEATPPVRDGC